MTDSDSLSSTPSSLTSTVPSSMSSDTESAQPTASSPSTAPPAATSSSISNSSEPTFLSLAQQQEKLAYIHNNKYRLLVLYGMVYLGDFDLVDRFTEWGTEGNHEQIVLKNMSVAKDMYTAERASCKTAADQDDGDEECSDGDLAALFIITPVDKDGSTLSSDANWDGGLNSKFDPPPKFHNLTLRVRVGAKIRQFATFAPDNNNAAANLRKIMRAKAKSDNYDGGPSELGLYSLSHKLFKKLERNAKGSVIKPDLHGKPSFFSIDKYPFHTTHAIDDAKSISSNYRVRPLPAYENYMIIEPDGYEDTIGGSLVHVVFYLHHYIMKKNNTPRSVFSFELSELNVLSRGNAGTKRETDLEPSSPMKKLHLI